MGTRSAWSAERRARQAEIIRCTKPWKHSTGPRTPEGKANSSQNASAFRKNPKEGRIYDALQLLIENPCSAMSPVLWAEIESATPDVDWEKIEADIAMPMVDDELYDDLFDFPLNDLPGDGEHADPDSANDREIREVWNKFCVPAPDDHKAGAG